MATRVVHCKRSPYDVYVGRGPDPRTGVSGKWGNPFRIADGLSRMEALRRHAEWILDQPGLLASLHEIKDKVLGCWCRPAACHGDTLARLADMSGLVDGKSVLPGQGTSPTWKADVLARLFDPLADVGKDEPSIFGKE